MLNNVMSSKMPKKKQVINKGAPPSIELDDSDCEEINEDYNEELQCSPTSSTSNTTKLSQHDESKKIIKKLCTSLNKSDFLEDDEFDIVEDEEEDRECYTRGYLGGFVIFKSKPKLSTHFRPVEECLYKPSFRVKKEEMRKAGYWKDWEERLSKNVDFTPEDIEEELNNKIETVIEYFINFDQSVETCTEDTATQMPQKINMHASYLPTVQELKALQSLRIKVDSSGRKLKDIPTTYCSTHNATKQKFGIFSSREADKMRQNWEDFKRDYKFYDLRPLLGVRTLLLEGNAQKFTHTKVQYVSMDQHIAFLKYLGRGLENRSICQLFFHARTCLFGHASSSDCSNKPMTTRELHLMDHFFNTYGISIPLMEFLLDCKTVNQYWRMFLRFYRYRRCPFNSGPWSSGEVLRLLDAISHYSHKPETLQRTRLPGVYKSPISWVKVMERVQTRPPDECGQMFRTVVKQALRTRYYSNANRGEDVQWTAKHELLLIQELCKTTQDSVNRVNFYMLSKHPDFGPFCDDFLKRVAREVIHSRVPVNKRRYFDEALDYLAKEVIPVLSKKIEEHEEVFNSRYLSKAKDVMEVFPDYLNKYVIKMFSSLPLHESTDMAEAIQNLDETVDDPTDSPLPVNSDSEEISSTVLQSSTDSLPSRHSGGPLGAATKRKRKRQLHSNNSDNPSKRKRKKDSVADVDVVPVTPPLVSTNNPLDVITLD